jgi:hypothetical protein
MWVTIQLMFAGIWAGVWHWGVGIALIILLVGGAIFSQAIPVIGPYLTPIRKDMLWAAAIIAVFLGGQYLGGRDATARCTAREVVVEKVVDKVVTGVETDPANQPQPEKKGVKRKSPSDRWDNPEN